MVEFDFLGKDSIRYYNRVPVERQVFKNLGIFMKDKEPGDDLFDRLTVSWYHYRGWREREGEREREGGREGERERERYGKYTLLVMSSCVI